MKISYNWLQSHFDKKLPKPNELAELLTVHSEEAEGVEEKDGDYLFDIKILPNRAYDYMDKLGIIRDISAILRLDPKGLPAPKTAESAKIIIMRFDDVENILGIKISEVEIKDILGRLGMAVKKSGDNLTIAVPDFRPDIIAKEDVVEEIVRIYGYERVPAEPPAGMILPPKRNDILFFADAVRNILTALGFSEAYDYSFSRSGFFELYNPPSKDKKFLRANLTDGLLSNIKENGKRFKDARVFEIGKIFPAGGEIISLAGAVSKVARPVKGDGFYEMKGVVDEILRGLGIAEFYYEESSEKVANIRVGNAEIGVIDHNSFELNFDELVKLADEEAEYRPISKYPAILRDIAVFASINTKVVQVEDVIQNAAGELLQDDDLFDIYENDERKSLAFHLVFQSPDRTLTDEEVNAAMEKIFAAIEANPEWEVRR